MKSFLTALQFLTVIPIKIKHIAGKDIAKSLIYFPLVGLLLGLILATANQFLFLLSFSQFLINVALVVFLAGLTGGLHLDGLADTTDAFLSGKPKEEMLKIMRDSHIGVMGVLSLISITLLKIGLLSSISLPLKSFALVLLCVLSRWSVVWLMFLFPYAREEGKAKPFIEGMNWKIFIFSTLTAFIFAFLIWQIKGLIAFLIIAGVTYLFGKGICKKINGITGDTLGAAIELTEVITLLIVRLIEKGVQWIT